MQELTSPAFRERVDRETVVIVPFGALEAHGPHLPLGADTFQAEAVARAVGERTGALVAPTVPYGICQTFAAFSGTVSLSFDTLRSLARDILEGLARHGVRRVLCLTGHGSVQQIAALREAARSVTEAHGARIFVVCDYEVACRVPEGSDPELKGHAGALETSRVMAIREELVLGAPEVRFQPPPAWDVAPEPSVYFPDGVRGDPTRASRALGDAVQAAVVDRLVEMVESLGSEEL